MRFIDPRLAVALLLAIALLAGCSAPMPVPPTPAPSTPTPAAHAPAKPEIVPAAPKPLAAPPAAAHEPSAALKKQFAVAVAAMKAGQDQQAMDLFAVIAKQNLQLASPYTNLGILYYRQSRLKEAEDSFKAALQRDAKDFVAANYLGMIYRDQGRFAEAKAAYEQSLAAKPDYAYAHLNMAILYDLYLGDLDKALDHYQQYQKDGGAGDQQLAGWLADLQQRMKDTGGNAKP